jgi:hypothetical protein
MEKRTKGVNTAGTDEQQNKNITVKGTLEELKALLSLVGFLHVIISHWKGEKLA